jgi:hypothetical protein
LRARDRSGGRLGRGIGGARSTRGGRRPDPVAMARLERRSCSGIHHESAGVWIRCGGQSLSCESRAGRKPAMVQAGLLQWCVSGRETTGVGGEQSELFLIWSGPLFPLRLSRCRGLGCSNRGSTRSYADLSCLAYLPA